MLPVILTIFCANARASELKYVQTVEGGYLLTPENIVALANYIRELEDENARLKAEAEALRKAREEETRITDQLLAEKDKVISLQQKELDEKNMLIRLLEKQVDDLRFVYENSKPSVLDQVYLIAGGAGLAAAVAVLASFMK